MIGGWTFRGGGVSGWLRQQREVGEMKQQIEDRMTNRRWCARIIARCRVYSVPTGLYNDAQTKGSQSFPGSMANMANRPGKTRDSETETRIGTT